MNGELLSAINSTEDVITAIVVNIAQQKAQKIVRVTKNLLLSTENVDHFVAYFVHSLKLLNFQVLLPFQQFTIIHSMLLRLRCVVVVVYICLCSTRSITTLF